MQTAHCRLKTGALQLNLARLGPHYCPRASSFAQMLRYTRADLAAYPTQRQYESVQSYAQTLARSSPYRPTQSWP